MRSTANPSADSEVSSVRLSWNTTSQRRVGSEVSITAASESTHTPVFSWPEPILEAVTPKFRGGRCRRE